MICQINDFILFFKQSESIPLSLPISSMNSAPSLNYIKKYMPDFGEKNVNSKIIYIKKWVDNSSNHGIGYLLSNGNYGALFNDKSSIISNKKTNMIYYKSKKRKHL